jgi:hypothetical protein
MIMRMIMILSRSTLHTVKRRKGNWIGHTLRRNCLLEHIITGMTYGREEEDADISSYWMTLRKEGDSGN